MMTLVADPWGENISLAGGEKRHDTGRSPQSLLFLFAANKAGAEFYETRILTSIFQNRFAFGEPREAEAEHTQRVEPKNRFELIDGCVRWKQPEDSD